MRSKYLKSPLNYTGGKYHLLKQIIPLFPKDIDNFIDLFAGGCNMSINVDAKKIFANDIDEKIIELYHYFRENTSSFIVNEIERKISEYGLSDTTKNGFEVYGTNSMLGVAKYNKLAYERLRQDYNKNKTPLMLYLAIVFSFNNQIRFNHLGEFNSAVNKRDFNYQIKKNLILFVDRFKELDITFSAKDYKDVEIMKDSFIYLDPPYLVSNATYNEKSGWSYAKEEELLSYIDYLDTKNIKFALSNVFESKSKKNELLIAWSKQYKVCKLNSNYHNCNYQAKNTKQDLTKEVLITNY